jgi:hypothetical protein
MRGCIGGSLLVQFVPEVDRLVYRARVWSLLLAKCWLPCLPLAMAVASLVRRSHAYSLVVEVCAYRDFEGRALPAEPEQLEPKS